MTTFTVPIRKRMPTVTHLQYIRSIQTDENEPVVLMGGLILVFTARERPISHVKHSENKGFCKRGPGDWISHQTGGGLAGRVVSDIDYIDWASLIFLQTYVLWAPGRPGRRPGATCQARTPVRK